MDSKISEFLPKGYQVPDKTTGYFKFEEGANRFRALCSPIIGWETWVDTDEGGRKPLRTPMDKPFTFDITDDPTTIKHFWAMVVWNYQTEKLQILEITQKSIQKAIRALASDEDWGSPLQYDIVITKTGQKLETEYSVQPKPAKAIDKKILDLYGKAYIRLEALYEGADPFTKTSIKEDTKQADTEFNDDVAFS